MADLSPIEIRRFARREIKNCLAHPELGFNARARELAQQYEGLQLAVDFDGELGLGNFRAAFCEPSEDPVDVEMFGGDLQTGISAFQYTEGAVNAKDTLGRKFGGAVEVITDFYFRVDGESQTHQRLMRDFEDVLDLVDDAAFGALTETAYAWPADALYNNDYNSTKSRLVLLPKGAFQRLQVRTPIFIKRGITNG